MQPRLRQEVMDIGYAPGDGIFDGDHAKVSPAVDDRGEGVLEAGAGQRLPVRIDVEAGDMGIRARLALIRDHLLHLHLLMASRRIPIH
jgi:hypothetical protein